MCNFYEKPLSDLQCPGLPIQLVTIPFRGVARGLKGLEHPLSGPSESGPSESGPSEAHLLHLVFLHMVLLHVVSLHLVILHLVHQNLVLFHVVLN